MVVNRSMGVNNPILLDDIVLLEGRHFGSEIRLDF